MSYFGSYFGEDAGGGGAGGGGYSAYPVAADLQAFLEAAGLTLSIGQQGQLEGAVLSAIRDLETATGRVFQPLTATRRFDPPTGTATLILGQDLASLTSLTYSPVGGSPVVYAAGVDFILSPWDAPDRRLPYDAIVFDDDTRRWNYPLPLAQRGSLYVAGEWGWPEVPENAWNAILARAAWGLSSLLSPIAVDGVVEVQQAVTRVKYSEDLLGTAKATWGGKDGAGGLWGAAVAAYKRQEQVAPPAIRAYEAAATAPPSVFAVAPTVRRRRPGCRGLW